MKRIAVVLVACAWGCSSAPSTDGNDASVDAPSASDARVDQSTPTDASDAAAIDAGPDASRPGWKLVWSDEFNGADGTAPDPTIWTHEVGGQGWGNNELEYYTDGTENSVQSGGNLVITATTAGASQYNCANDGAGGACQYTSARITTQATKTSTGFSQTYGRFEARMQLPAGKGLWPAFWLLGTNITQVNWPACGEIDVMESLGDQTSVDYGHLHMLQGTNGNYGPGATYTLPQGTFAEAFHVFAIEWQLGQVDFFVDDTKYATVLSSSTPSNATWAFDGHPFYVILNLAVGSKDSWPTAPDGSTKFPAQLLVDYVRVYTKSP